MNRDDLLADLQGDLAGRASVPDTARAAAAAPAAPRTRPVAATPALDVSLTPLQWSLPRVERAVHGVGVCLRCGPVVVSVGVR